MKISYLVDTDWIIDHLNKVKKVTRKLQELKPDGIALSVISLAELYEGVHYSKDPGRSQEILQTFLGDFRVLGIDKEICKVFGKERGKLRREGQMISDFDLLIASTCLYHNLILLTNNKKHYGRIDGLNIFSLL